jgi:ATP-dependent RNA helicase RhlE
MSFSSFGLSEEIMRAVVEQGYTEPTPIQTQAIPVVMTGGDLLAAAQTGTGKTAGFVLPILHRLSDKTVKGPSNGRAPVRALILTPTRELAAQVEESVRDYGRFLKLNSMAIFGGVNIRPQITRFRNRVDILVATPGRLLDHVQQRTVDLSKVEVLVLDEADRMLDMGFIRDVKKILAQLPQQRQNLLFSATFSNDIKKLADNLLDHPKVIEVAKRNITADNIAQKIYHVDRQTKRHLLAHLIKDGDWEQVLVFTRTKHGADKLCEQLVKNEIRAVAIHGNKRQTARTRALGDFKSGKVRVLVATDIAARGIDISSLPHVVNFELPHVPEDYVHRIGRTGRAGANGEAVSLVCVDEHKLLADIEKMLKRSLPAAVVEGFEPDPNAKPQPISNGRGSRSQQPKRSPRKFGNARSGPTAGGGGNRPRSKSRRQRARGAA